jgi:hypothetical protein
MKALFYPHRISFEIPLYMKEEKQLFGKNISYLRVDVPYSNTVLQQKPYFDNSITCVLKENDISFITSEDIRSGQGGGAEVSDRLEWRPDRSCCR